MDYGPPIQNTSHIMQELTAIFYLETAEQFPLQWWEPVQTALHMWRCSVLSSTVWHWLCSQLSATLQQKQQHQTILTVLYNMQIKIMPEWDTA